MIITIRALEDVHVGDIYKSLAKGETVRFHRFQGQLEGMKALSTLVENSQVVVSVALEGSETADAVLLHSEQK